MLPDAYQLLCYLVSLLLFLGTKPLKSWKEQGNLHFSLSEKLRFYPLNCREKPKNFNACLKAKEIRARELCAQRFPAFLATFRDSGIIRLPESIFHKQGRGWICSREGSPSSRGLQGTYCLVCSRLA